jgi:hypothetical protein
MKFSSSGECDTSTSVVVGAPWEVPKMYHGKTGGYACPPPSPAPKPVISFDAAM